jgi:heterodisulfide reductase subunit A
VGCRNEERPYCSRVCCSESIKNALKIKELNPTTHVYLLYRDIRTYGFTELYYQEASRVGVKFVRYEEDEPPVVTNDNGLIVKVKDKLLDEELLIKTDILALGAATLPPPGNSELVGMLGLRMNNDNFFLESHTKFSPVEFICRGVYVAGLAHSPKFFEECISQAEAAVARASTILWKKEMELDPRKSEVIFANCDGCAYCVDPCPFNAIKLIEYKKDGFVRKIVERDEATCRGCGTCMATCPKQGIMVRGFTLGQLGAMVDAALSAE